MPDVSQTDVVIAGHICLDVIQEFNARDNSGEQVLSPGKLIHVGPAIMSTGGAVSNTGLALHRLGFSAHLIGKVGNDLFGRAILEIIGNYNGLLTKGMIVSEGESTSYSVVINQPNVDRIFLHCPGTNASFVAANVNTELLKHSRIFHFGYPVLMRNMYREGGKELAKMMEAAKETGITTSLDTASPDPDSEEGKQDWKSILQSTMPFVDIFSPSFEEICFMLDRPIYNQLQSQFGGVDMIRHADSALLSGLASQLLEMGAAIVAIKLGDQGLYLRTTSNRERLMKMGRCRPKQVEGWLNRELFVPCFQVDVAGTTGSGDCTIAGFLGGLLQEKPLEDAMIGAVAVGAFNVEKVDAISGIPSWSAVQKRIAAGWAQRPVAIKLPKWLWDDQKRIWQGPKDHWGR